MSCRLCILRSTFALFHLIVHFPEYSLLFGLFVLLLRALAYVSIDIRSIHSQCRLERVGISSIGCILYESDVINIPENDWSLKNIEMAYSKHNCAEHNSHLWFLLLDTLYRDYDFRTHSKITELNKAESFCVRQQMLSMFDDSWGLLLALVKTDRFVI